MRNKFDKLNSDMHLQCRASGRCVHYDGENLENFQKQLIESKTYNDLEAAIGVAAITLNVVKIKAAAQALALIFYNIGRHAAQVESLEEILTKD